MTEDGVNELSRKCVHFSITEWKSYEQETQDSGCQTLTELPTPYLNIPVAFRHNICAAVPSMANTAARCQTITARCQQEGGYLRMALRS